MDREGMQKYYETFNTGNLEAIATCYTEDVVLEYHDMILNGRNAVMGHFKEYFNSVREHLTPLQIVIEDNNIAVELSDTLTAKIDLPDLMGEAVNAGESVIIKFGGFYKAHGNKIYHITLYS